MLTMTTDMQYAITVAGQRALIAVGLWLFIVILMAAIMGFIAHRLAGKKGYTGYLWTGFFLKIVGLKYVAGLPVRRDDCRRARDLPNL